MNDSPTLLLRPARAEDAVRCGDIAVAAWEPIYESFRQMVGDGIFATQWPDWRVEKRRQVEEFIGEYPHWAFVTEVDGAIAGFVTYILREATKTGEIGNNAVDPAFQGHGIGTRQCERVLDAMREEGMAVATVYTGLDEAHAPARAVYERIGFDRQTPHVKYYMEL